jgi:hypothetical protein
MTSKTTSLLKVESPFAYYSVPVKGHCPFCKFYYSRTKTYRTLKSLNHHIVTYHKTESFYPITLDETKEILKNIAKALQWGILP